MAHERSMQPDIDAQVLHLRRPIEERGRTYYFSCNAKRGDKVHRKYQSMLDSGKLVLIREDAVDHFGKALAGYVAIYQARSKPIRDSATWIASRPVRRGS